MEPRRRHKKGIPEHQRQALRLWYFEQRPKPRHSECIKWFLDQFQRTLNQSTVSESLGPRFKYLDTKDSSHTDTTRNQQGQWPRLEAMLNDWQVLVESWNQEISDTTLLGKAKEFWHIIPEYRDKTEPHFSSGWLQRFKQRHNIRERVRHGEAASVPEEAHTAMVLIRELCKEYN